MHSTRPRTPRAKSKKPPLLHPAETPSLDSLDQWMREMDTHGSGLTYAQEADLAQRIQRGEEEALHTLVESNLRFVVSIAKKYQGQGVELSDLINEGNLGLIIAARKFDPTENVKFISYAVWWIRQRILQALAEQGRSVRIPLNRHSKYLQIQRTEKELQQKLGRTPTPREVAASCGFTLPEVEEAMGILHPPVRMDRSLGNLYEGENPDTPHSRNLELSVPTDFDEHLMVQDRDTRLRAALHHLSERDAKVLRLYFGIEYEEPATLEQIGEMLGVTRERVRQIKERALKHLRSLPEIQPLREVEEALPQGSQNPPSGQVP